MKFVHTNIVANDYRRLAEFYKSVFGCVNHGPTRNLKGVWIEDGTGIKGAEIEGVHLLLPGYGEDGPTLEIFQYNKTVKGGEKKINRLGYAHIAFQVDNIHDVIRKVILNGGSQVGKVTNKEIENVGTISFVYVYDPEGNIIELQKWI
jgi:predicted enzyme related to lactoylglutathione lyase